MTHAKLNPLSNRLAVKRAGAKEKTDGGIIIPEVAKTKSVVAEVMAVGPGKVASDGTRIPMSVQPGDTVLLGHWKGDEIELDDQKYVIISEDDVLGVFASDSSSS